MPAKRPWKGLGANFADRAPASEKKIDRTAIVSAGLGTIAIEMSKNTLTVTVRNALASLIGYPPVIAGMLPRRLHG